jgi:hypothetical protein
MGERDVSMKYTQEDDQIVHEEILKILTAVELIGKLIPQDNLELYNRIEDLFNCIEQFSFSMIKYHSKKLSLN